MATKTRKNLTAKSAYDRIASVAETIRNGDPAAIAVMSAGDVVRQGDLYLIALDESPTKAKPYLGRQLAPGSTQGSRHVVDGECYLFEAESDSALAILNRLIPATEGFEVFLGPAIVAAEPVTITHPEHGHRTLPAGAYLTTYQRSWANEVRRQED